MKKTFLVLTLVSLSLVSIFAEGQGEKAYPAKAIEIVVPSSAGGSTDAMARIFAQVAKKHLEGSEFVIVNKPGSGGQQGFEYIAAAKPDGYTIGTVFTVQLPSHSVSGRARYIMDDFHFLSMVLDDPSIVVVPKDSPINSLEDLIDTAKKQELTASVNGIGSDDHLAMILLQEATGIQLSLIPASGSTEQKASIMGGHVDVAFMNLSQMTAQHNAGEAKIISLLSGKRDELIPDVKTATEVGYKVKMTGTRGFAIQHDVPDDIKKVLEKLMLDVCNDPEFAQTLKDSNQSFTYMDGPGYKEYLNELTTSMETIYKREPW